MLIVYIKHIIFYCAVAARQPTSWHIWSNDEKKSSLEYCKCDGTTTTITMAARPNRNKNTDHSLVLCVYISTNPFSFGERYGMSKPNAQLHKHTLSLLCVLCINVRRVSAHIIRKISLTFYKCTVHMRFASYQLFCVAITHFVVKIYFVFVFFRCCMTSTKTTTNQSNTAENELKKWDQLTYIANNNSFKCGNFFLFVFIL